MAFSQEQYEIQKENLRQAMQSDPGVNNLKRARAVEDVCRVTVREWNANDSWPDDWSAWQRALDDNFGIFESPRIEDME